MTIAMTPLEELDFPTPELTEDWEASPEDIKGWFAYFEAEDQWHTDYRSWLEAETKTQNDWGYAEMVHWRDTYASLQHEVSCLTMSAPNAIQRVAVDMIHPERCYCSPSRGMMMNSSSYDIYGSFDNPFNRRHAHVSRTMEYKRQIDQLNYVRDWVIDRITPAKPAIPAIAQGHLSDTLVARRPVSTPARSGRFNRSLWGQRA